jgi:hypothetical protein
VFSSFEERVLSIESSPDIMAIKNPNWYLGILWKRTDNVREKILLLLKFLILGRLHY